MSCYMYREFGSKTHKAVLNSDNKVVKQYQNISGKGPCHVKILDIYFSKIPTAPIGKNKLNGLLKEMCAETGLSKDFSNHSLHDYGTTTLFQAKVHKKLIQMRTDHKSLKALRSYECSYN